MPRVALTDAQRLKQRLSDGDKALVKALNHYKVDNGLDWGDVAGRLQIGVTTLARWRSRPGTISMDHARRIASAIRMTPEEWLAFGGYKP